VSFPWECICRDSPSAGIISAYSRSFPALFYLNNLCTLGQGKKGAGFPSEEGILTPIDT
jgi:hypothetical protein